MNSEEEFAAKLFSGFLKESSGLNIQTLELFAGMYICEKLRQDLTEKAADILEQDIAHKFCTPTHEPEENTPAEPETPALTLAAKMQRKAKA